MTTGTDSHSNEMRLVGLLAEFDGPEALVEAALQMREAGYHSLEGFSPFPIHKLDKALAIRSSPLPWLVLAGGVAGAAAAIGGQWWTNAIDFPFRISGKPLFSLPANIPVAFELTILLSALAAFFGMLALNQLPKLANPLFRSRRFPRATTDGFFLLVEPWESSFSPLEARRRLESLGAVEVEECREPEDGGRMPRFVIAALAIAASLALIPPLWIAGAKARTSGAPRLHTFPDMDFQPKLKSQTAVTMFVQGHQLFEDGRAMRRPVSGTVARGELEEDDRLYRGIEPAADSHAGADGGAGNGAAAETAEAAAKPKGSADSPGEVEPNWVETIPVPVTAGLMDRGQQRYNIYCAVCHGRAGDGDGLVSARALELEQGAWIQPTSIHAESVREQPVGKLFNAISNGVRKMPSYRDQISAEDRWAVVLYLRALQRSRAASPEDAPPEELKTLRETK